MIQDRIDTLSPLPVLDRLPIDAGTALVVREDLLPGGTKQRAILPYLTDALSAGATSFVYASPAPGFAQVALAYVCAALDVPCTVYCARIDGALHDFALLARAHGADVRPVDSLAEAEVAAELHAVTDPDCRKLPLGFDDACYRGHYRAAVTEAWDSITRDLGHTPRRLWLPVGSGTLARTFRETLPPEVALHCVDVRVLDRDDPRVRCLPDLPGVTVYRAAQAFDEPCDDPAPVPSNAHYDAKLWHYVRTLGADGDLWWNVAR